ncbi:MAG: hypothetical protein NC078_10155 [Ruminococcus sp.]|nr:hypothetical protein [Ruminococcus sp.]
MGGDIQERIAEISDVIFKLDGERLLDGVTDEIALGAARLRAVKLPDMGKMPLNISRIRLLERIKKAEEETEEIMNSLALRQRELYKAEAVYTALADELKRCGDKLGNIRREYGDDGRVTPRRLSDLEMSEMVAMRYINMAQERRKAVRTLCEAIASLRGNAYPLWRGAVRGALDNPERENVSRAEYLRGVMAEEMKRLVNSKDLPI